MPNNKVNYGLCKMAYAIITETAGVISYGDPVMLPGAVNLTCAPIGDETEFEADNIIFHRGQGNDGYDITLEIANIPDEFLRDVMGEVVDDNDVNFESAADTIKRVALLGQFDGDIHKKRFAFYYCLPKRSNFDGATSRRKEPKTRTLTLAADPRPTDEIIKASTTAETDAAVYAAWFDEVYEKTVATGG